MRKPFIEKLTELAAKDPKVILIVGDVGFSFLEDFKAKFPNQFLNIGICEQAMMGVARGMSLLGWKPYVYSMINFIVFRPYEQVRNDLAWGNANVKLFGVKGSEAYRFLGYSHNIYKAENKVDFKGDVATEIDGKKASGLPPFNSVSITNDEDRQLMSHLPNMNCYWPETEQQATDFIELEYNRQGPAYFRI